MAIFLENIQCQEFLTLSYVHCRVWTINYQNFSPNQINNNNNNNNNNNKTPGKKDNYLNLGRTG